jgi:hypothetical protein
MKMITSSKLVSALLVTLVALSILGFNAYAEASRIPTTIHVWEGYMGMPAMWLDYPTYHNPLTQGEPEQVRYWVEAADGTYPCGMANYYIDDQAAGGEWNVTSPQPQYWEGCPGGLPGGAGGLYLRPNDTANLSVGWHTLKIYYLGDNKYAPAEYTAQFLVIAAGQPWPSLSIGGGLLEPGNPAYLEWDVINRGTGDAWVAPYAKFYLQAATPPYYEHDGDATGYYVNDGAHFTYQYGGLGWVHVSPGDVVKVYSQAVVPPDARWAVYNAYTYYTYYNGWFYPNWDVYATLR